MLKINAQIRIPDSELDERFMRSPGPGGQNVNKVETAVQLRFDAAGSPSLPDEVRTRLLRIAGRRVDTDGVLMIEAHRYRTRERNRADARARLAALIEQASRRPKPRIPTRPTKASTERRLEDKRRQAASKRLRRTSTQRDSD